MIYCVRPIPWIIDSVKRLLRRNPFELFKIFSFEQADTVYSRAEGLMTVAGIIGFALDGLKQAMQGDQARRLLLLPYDTLAADPAAAMQAVYEFTGLPAFRHDFTDVSFDASEFDARLGTPGLHDVRRRVAAVERKTILPPDLWQRYARASIWRVPAFDTGGVSIACEPMAAPSQADHRPQSEIRDLALHRQSETFAREGIEIDTSTLADWVGACTATLSPLVALIRAHVLAAERVHGDDTTVPVQACGNMTTGRLWAYVRDDRPFAGPAPPAALFHYSPDQRGEHPQRHLAGYAGILQADAYAGFGELHYHGRKPGPVTEAGCWAELLKVPHAQHVE